MQDGEKQDNNKAAVRRKDSNIQIDTLGDRQLTERNVDTNRGLITESELI